MSSPRKETGDDFGDLFTTTFNNAQYPLPLNGHVDKRYSISNDAGIAASPKSVEDEDGHDSGKEDATNANNELKLNARSCVTCRARKVRCDKREPCSNCVKANHACVFPPPGRARRKPKRPHDTELLKRLRRLESVVDSLGSRVDEDGNVVSNDKPKGAQRSTSVSGSNGSVAVNSPSRQATLEQRVGSLVVKEGRSRYIADEFWQALGHEITEMKNVLDDNSSEDEDDEDLNKICPSAPEGSYSSHQEFVLGYSSTSLDMRKLHPSPTQIWIIWEIFKENIDPVTKILHVPTVRNIVMKAAVSASNLDRPSEALFFSMCFASIISMTDDQCQQLLGGDKWYLVRRYRFAVEQTFARASFLSSNNFAVLQALVLYITVVKVVDQSRSIWMLTVVAMQMARLQGLHRDGTNFRGLSPYDIEMRRRLWWHIFSQDFRAAEDHGTRPMALSCDTKIPLNVNDEDIWPGMTETPIDRTGHTDLSFCLLRFEMGIAMRKLKDCSLGDSDTEAYDTVEAKENLVEAVQQHLSAKHFVDYDPTNPLMIAAFIVSKLIIAKLWLVIHHPRLMHMDDNKTDLQALKDRVFVKSVEVIELAMLIMYGKETEKWAWLFKTYMQWHSVAYILSELNTKPIGPDYDRGWRAIDDIYATPLMRRRMLGKGSSLWRPMKAMYDKANARRCELTGVRKQIQTPPVAPDTQLSPSTNSPDSAQPATDLFFSDGFINANPYSQIPSGFDDNMGMDFNDFPMNPLSNNNFFGLDSMMTNNEVMANITQSTSNDANKWLANGMTNNFPNNMTNAWPSNHTGWQWPNSSM